MRPIVASDLMNPEILTVREDMTVRDLAAFLIDNEISGAPVVSKKGKLVGVVSMVDIAEVASEGADEPAGEGRGESPAFFQRTWKPSAGADAAAELEELDLDGEELLVADIMTPNVYSVAEDATVSEIAKLMLKHHLHRVLVTDGDQAQGIISSSDLLGLLVDED